MTVDLDLLLDHFAARVPHVTHAVAMSTDGQILAGRSGLPDHRRDRLATVCASMISLLHGASMVLNTGQVISNIVHMDSGFMFTVRLSSETSLLVVASTDCDVAQVGQELTLIVTSAAPEALPGDPALRSPRGEQELSTSSAS